MYHSHRAQQFQSQAVDLNIVCFDCLQLFLDSHKLLNCITLYAIDRCYHSAFGNFQFYCHYSQYQNSTCEWPFVFHVENLNYWKNIILMKTQLYNWIYMYTNNIIIVWQKCYNGYRSMYCAWKKNEKDTKTIIDICDETAISWGKRLVLVKVITLPLEIFQFIVNYHGIRHYCHLRRVITLTCLYSPKTFYSPPAHLAWQLICGGGGAPTPKFGYSTPKCACISLSSFCPLPPPRFQEVLPKPLESAGNPAGYHR